MALNFEKYAQEGNHFLNQLAEDLGHPKEMGKTSSILRAVLHTFRERLTISQSFHLMAQLPMFLKAIYVDNWKYSEKPLKLSTKEQFASEVERYQKQYGELDFDWDKSTEEIIQIVFRRLRTFISDGEFHDIMSQLPQEIRDLFQ
ncbi:MAG: DUF2267 domain-containing protein [Bacteroidota bacterium]